MSYSGVLTSRPGDTGVRADFEFGTERVVVTCEKDTFEWSWEEMRIAPWDTTTVRLNLPDGELFYRADDPLRFADAVEEASDPTSGSTRRWWDSVFSSPPRQDQVVGAPTRPSRSGRHATEPTVDSAAEPTLTQRAAAIDLADPFEAQTARETKKPSDRRPSKRRIFWQQKDHSHSWAAATVNGGLIRRVCEECHHVSIDLRISKQSAAVETNA